MPNRPQPSRRTVLAWGAAVAAASTLPRRPALAAPVEDRLNIYNWSDYIGRATIKNFQKEHALKLVYDTYESNEEMLAKVAVGGSQYDLVFPGADVAKSMIARGLLHPLQKDLIPNLGNIAPMFLDRSYDPGNQYTVPYQWGTSGIAFRSDLVKVPTDTWAVFHNAALSGKMTQLDDMHDVIGSWLKYRGRSLNSRDATELAEAKTDALAAKANLRAYLSAPVKNQLIAGEIHVAHLWSGDAAQAATENPAIKYLVPKEGGAIWTDVMAIPKDAPHKNAAHAFIEFVLRPEVQAEITTYTMYGTPNQEAMKVLPNALAFPTDEELTKLEYFDDLGSARELWDRLWTEIKAS